MPMIVPSFLEEVTATIPLPENMTVVHWSCSVGRFSSSALINRPMSASLGDRLLCRDAIAGSRDGRLFREGLAVKLLVFNIQI